MKIFTGETVYENRPFHEELKMRYAIDCLQDFTSKKSLRLERVSKEGQ